ncbi:ubiquitin carrier protein 7 [Zea mays]|uniref:Ubiquitin carrier protein 7 n=1 Tax=Zea mays TaxID=4577 RepID=A0A1D6EQJ0_MAIZE|nr:ubiquitin carrier protein 7 [Zea mays]
MSLGRRKLALKRLILIGVQNNLCTPKNVDWDGNSHLLSHFLLASTTIVTLFCMHSASHHGYENEIQLIDIPKCYRINIIRYVKMTTHISFNYYGFFIDKIHA